MVEGARLERVYTGNRIEGSNPSVSATRWPVHMNRVQLRNAEGWIWRRAIKSLRSSRRWQMFIKIGLILIGAVLGAVGGAMEGPLVPSAGSGILT